MTTAYKNLKERIIGTTIGVIVMFGLPMYGVINLACSGSKNSYLESPSKVSENNYSNTVFYGNRPVNVDKVRKNLETRVRGKNQ